MPYKNLHPLYYVWTSMIQRCHQAHHASFKHYGARGIEVCSRWRGSFEAFRDDMGERPPGTSIDRINVDLGYEPGNCRWASPKEQQRNRTNNKLNQRAASEIAALCATRALSKQAIADRYGVSRAMVRKIAEGRAWQS